jgi:hypothetical protein
MEEQRSHSQATGVATKSVTNTKLAVATAFLGFAALAAGLVSAPQSAPDLVIRKIAAQADNEANKVIVYYQNVGKKAVTSPYTVHVKISQLPVAVDTVSVKQTKPSANVSTNPQTMSATGALVIPVELYSLKPQEYGMIEITYGGYHPAEAPVSSVISAYVDRERNIAETNETNNSATITVLTEQLVFTHVLEALDWYGYGYNPFGNYTYDYGYGYGYNAQGQYGYGEQFGYGYNDSGIVTFGYGYNRNRR